MVYAVDYIGIGKIYRILTLHKDPDRLFCSKQSQRTEGRRLMMVMMAVMAVMVVINQQQQV